jgi:hypothetical protein
MKQPQGIKKTWKTGEPARRADGGESDKGEAGKMDGRSFGVQSLR